MDLLPMSSEHSFESPMGDEPGVAPARNKRKKKRARPLNGHRKTAESIQQGSDELDTLCHHDPHTMAIVRDVREWLRSRDNIRTKAEDRQYAVPKFIRIANQ